MRKNLLRFLSTAALAVAATVGASAQSNLADLVITNNGTGANAGRDTLRYGVNSAATNGRDAALGEDELPPAPPSAVFDVRWVNNIAADNFGEGLKRNQRAYTSPTQLDTFKVKIQAGDGGYPVTITWGSNVPFATATFRYFDGATFTPVSVNMKTQTSVTISVAPLGDPSIYTGSPSVAATGISVSPSPLAFGLVSIPTPGQKTDSITITNNGTSSVTIDSVVSNSTLFTVKTPPSFPTSLAGGASLKVGVTFATSNPGNETATIQVYHSTTGSPASVTATATASSGEGLYLLNTDNRLRDNRLGAYSQIIGLKYSGATPAQGLQFKVASNQPYVRIAKVELGSGLGSPASWNFDYEVTYAASGSEAQVILYGSDASVNFPNTTAIDSLFVVTLDVSDIKTCNGDVGGDSLTSLIYLHSIQSSLADDLGTPAGIIADADRDTANYSIHNSSARGDVNCDDKVNILDVLMDIDKTLGRLSFDTWQINRADLAPWSSVWSNPATIFDDANNYGDTKVNVQDVTLTTNAILNENWPDGEQLFRAYDGGEKGSQINSIYDVKLRYTVTPGGVVVSMNNLVPVKGLQMKLRAADAPADMKAVLVEALAAKFTVQEAVINGEVRLLLYSLSGEAISPAEMTKIMHLPFSVSNLSNVAVIEPITAGGAKNEGLLVEYEVVTSTSGVDREAIARSFELEATPNPTSDDANVSFRLASPAGVTVALSDVAGNEVVRILDGARYGTGSHTVAIDTRSLAAGTYYVTFSADGVTTARKLVIVR